MNRLAFFATLLLTLAPVSSVSAQSAKKHKIGADKKFGKPLLPADEAGIRLRAEEARRRRGVRQHPEGRSRRGTAQHFAELVGRRQFGGLRCYPVSGDFPQQRFNQG